MQIEKSQIRELLKKDDPLVLELGAHRGGDAKQFLEEFGSIKIYCFEPDPRCIKRFKKNIKDLRCTLIEAAVSDKDGVALLTMSTGYDPQAVPPKNIAWFVKAFGLRRFYLQFLKLIKRDWDLSSSIKTPTQHPKTYPWMEFKKQVEVKTISLDSWVKQNDIRLIDFIWSDIQGAEREMIRGATEALKITRYLYTEYGETNVYAGAMTREETIALMQEHDFKVVPKYSKQGLEGNLLFKNKNY